MLRPRPPPAPVMETDGRSPKAMRDILTKRRELRRVQVPFKWVVILPSPFKGRGIGKFPTPILSLLSLLRYLALVADPDIAIPLFLPFPFWSLWSLAILFGVVLTQKLQLNEDGRRLRRIGQTH